MEMIKVIRTGDMLSHGMDRLQVRESLIGHDINVEEKLPLPRLEAITSELDVRRLMRFIDEC